MMKVCSVHGAGVKLQSAPNVPVHEWCIFSALRRQKALKNTARAEGASEEKLVIFVEEKFEIINFCCAQIHNSNL